MRKVMNFRFMTIEEIEIKEYTSWVTGEIEYDLVYDTEGDLYGVIIDNLEEDVVTYLEENYNSCGFDFPTTLEEYNNK